MQDIDKTDFFKQLQESYAKIKENKKEWEEYLKELEDWDATLSDGLI